jgi:homoaconitate hydratase family protein
MTQKILATHSNKDFVCANDYVVADLDLAFAHDPVMAVLTEKFYQTFGRNGKVWDPSKVAFFQDHLVPAKSIDATEMIQIMQSFVDEQNIKYYFPYGKNYGVCHILIMENRLARPGEIIVGTDSHTVTCGSFNCFATGVGVFDMSVALGVGKAWFRVPETIKISLKGEFRKDVGSKDLILYLIGQLKLDGAKYCSLEWEGEVLESMSMDERSTLCNMSVEAGATNSIMSLNHETREFLKSDPQGDCFEEVATDQGYEYSKTIEVNLDSLEQMVAKPHKPDNVSLVSELEDIRIHQVYVGSCTGGKFEDIKNFHNSLKGRSVSNKVTTIVVPATVEIYKKLFQQNIAQSLMEQGVAIESPGCKACYGVHGGVTRSNENCLATINRNFIGRMGNPKSSIYLASPQVAAETAIAGFIKGL